MKNPRSKEKKENALTDQDRCQETTASENEEKPEKVGFSEYLLLTLTGYGIILIPVVLIIAGMALLAAWLFGAFR
ncbi:MAG: hypothetical protein IKZ44_03435 [Clostridia bacterium]|nr:hypothetical protein [Clostridia bacterium]